MEGIYIAALIAFLILLVPFFILIIKRLKHSDRLIASIWAIFAGSAFFGAYYLLRIPLDHVLHALFQNIVGNFRWVASLYAPLTEEPAKWISLIPLFLLARIKNDNKAVWAICLGIGFGIGEIFFLAQTIAINPQNAGLPWYYSSGFIMERLMVSFIHSAFYMIAIEAIINHKYWLVLLAPFFHWLLNMPIFLSIQFPFNDGGGLWSQLLWMWTAMFFIGSLIYLGTRLFKGTSHNATILGKAICPECQTLYVRPFFGMNRIGKRYERCPNCKHNHWTTPFNENENLSG
jgi:hypothetical protein